MKAALKKRFESRDSDVDANKASQNPSDEAPHIYAPPSRNDILRYRYHHGVNLGSTFVLERWLHSSMFDANSAGSSELDAVTVSIKTRGVDATRAKWEAHWAFAVSDERLRWLVNSAHCTTIRLPVGYFTLGAAFCVGTPSTTQVTQVYVNAWAAVKNLVARCLEYGVGVLLDFHALPGGANGEPHSGTSSGKAELWNKRSNLDLAVRCLCFMAQEAASMDGVIGLQVCNEAMWDAPGLYKFYDRVIERVSEVNPTLPIYISDAWNLERAVRYAIGKNGVKTRSSNPVVVDTHRYYTFAEKDTSRAPKEIIAQIANELYELNGTRENVFENKGACDVYVGEYSCTLSGQTWSRVPSNIRPAMTSQFGHAQSQRWQQMTCGSAFWTLNMDWLPGGDWGFQEQVDNGNITAPVNLSLLAAEVIERAHRAEDIRENRIAGAMRSHELYWNANASVSRFEHWRFADGWAWGWWDASHFFLARSKGMLQSGDMTPAKGATINGGDRIGMLDLWVLKRMREVGCADKDTCSYGWEWEQGFRQGLKAFHAVVDIC